MQIYIPSTCRADHVLTLDWIPKRWHGVTQLVVPEKQADDYIKKTKYNIGVIECPFKGIGPTRQWIMSITESRRICMLDDDLSFYVRRKDEPEHFLPAKPKDVDRLFNRIAATLCEDIPHLGVCPREGGNRFVDGNAENTRILRLLAYYVPTYRELGIRYDRMEFMEDFDVTLQLLRAGYPNVMLTAWAQGQEQSNAPGGCSTYRSLEGQAKSARKLAKLHAPFVKVVEKTTKSAWGGATRTDVIISWKKAYASSQR